MLKEIGIQVPSEICFCILRTPIASSSFHIKYLNYYINICKFKINRPYYSTLVSDSNGTVCRLQASHIFNHFPAGQSSLPHGCCYLLETAGAVTGRKQPFKICLLILSTTMAFPSTIMPSFLAKSTLEGLSYAINKPSISSLVPSLKKIFWRNSLPSILYMGFLLILNLFAPQQIFRILAVHYRWCILLYLS